MIILASPVLITVNDSSSKAKQAAFVAYFRLSF